MSSIIVTNPSSHSQMPWVVQRELKGLEFSLSCPMSFVIVGPETAGAFELQRNFNTVTNECYAVSRDNMILVAEAKGRWELHLWLQMECKADMFFFTKDSCTYNP